MLPGGLDVLYRNALAASHEPYNRTEVWGDGVKLADDLILYAGSISATLSSEVTRTLSFSTLGTLYPVADTDLLAPLGNEIRAYKGIVFGDGTRYEWPVFRGKINDVGLSESGMTEVTCDDRCADVIANGFRAPTNSSVGMAVTDQMRVIINDALPDATFGTFDVFTEHMPIMAWDQDRGRALSEMATSIGAFWYALADGSFVVRRYPWTVPGDPVVTYSDESGGTITAANPRRSRSGIYNSITVTAERLDGSTPVYATADDDDPTSPTYVEGKFGRRSKVVQLNTPQNTETAENAARLLVQRTTGAIEEWTFSAIADAALELGDVISLNALGRKGVVQVVQSITLPMDTSGSMSVTCRAQVIQQLQGAA